METSDWIKSALLYRKYLCVFNYSWLKPLYTPADLQQYYTHTFHIKLFIITTVNTSITLSSGSWLQDKHKLMWACQI